MSASRFFKVWAAGVDVAGHMLGVGCSGPSEYVAGLTVKEYAAKHGTAFATDVARVAGRLANDVRAADGRTL